MGGARGDGDLLHERVDERLRLGQLARPEGLAQLLGVGRERPHVVDAHIVSKLVRKLGEDAGHPRYIFTESRAGFGGVPMP